MPPGKILMLSLQAIQSSSFDCQPTLWTRSFEGEGNVMNCKQCDFLNHILPNELVLSTGLVI